MTFSVSSSSEVSSSSHAFESFDTKVCRIILQSLHEDFAAYIEKGLNPNHTLEEDVSLEGIVFPKGASLLFIILQCCTVSTSPWDLWVMAQMLLDKGVDLKKSIHSPRVYGGGGLLFWILPAFMPMTLMKRLFVRFLRPPLKNSLVKP